MTNERYVNQKRLYKKIGMIKSKNDENSNGKHFSIICSERNLPFWVILFSQDSFHFFIHSFSRCWWIWVNWNFGMVKNNNFPEEEDRVKWKLTTIIGLKEVKSLDSWVCRNV